ncbi:MAG TPA: hypothetical protein VFM37_04320 [Pseudonocardiaceae bacterium]|nr:hypothetical protein [Pseudonocardiaceae bacterium]
MNVTGSLAVALAVMVLSGCGSAGSELAGSPRAAASSGTSVPTGPPEPPTGTEPPTSTEPAPTTTPEPPPAFPEALVGTWISSAGTAEIVYQFAADGSYKYAGVLMQQRPSGTFSFTIGETGTASVDGTQLVLVPRISTESLSDPDSPSASYKDRPRALETEQLTWSLDRAQAVLTLDDGENPPVDYERQ